MAGLFDWGADNQARDQFKGLMGDIVGATATGMKPWLDNPAYAPAPMNPWQTQAGEGALGMLGRGGQAMDFANVGLGDIYATAGPLAEMMNERGQDQVNESYGRAASDIGQRAAAAGAFGGSREAVQRGMLAENMLDATNDMASGNDIAAYQAGMGLASGNADRSMNGLFGGMDRDMQALGLLGAFGDQRQAHDQAVRDAPYTTTQRLFGLASGNLPEEEAGWLQQLLGTVATGAGIFGGFAGGAKDMGWVK